MTRKPKVDKYFFEDNVRRLFLYDMLRRKECLKSLTLKQLDQLVGNINTLISNLDSNFKDGKIMINVEDKHNWEGSELFRNIFLHNVLDIKIKWGGSDRTFKDMLEKRWGEKPKKAKEMLDVLEEKNN